jgi:RNA polymerase sigma-70 factor (ECF subfamily)
MNTGADIPTLLARLCRQETGRLTGALARKLGAGSLFFAEDCVQDAFLSALQTWPQRGVPDNPFAWLLLAAHNRGIDRLRRHAMQGAIEPRVADWMRTLQHAHGDDLTGDEELQLIALCCDPRLEDDARQVLALKCVCGFSIEEIARAFLATPSAIAQRLVRAKARLKEGLVLETPTAVALQERLPSMLRTIYLLFNEGYSSTQGQALLRAEFCDEAIRLCRVLLSHAHSSAPEAHALCALMLLQHARRLARVSDEQVAISLEAQDRTLWDQAMIVEGFRHLSLAMSGDRLTAYHLEAGIASVHAAATDFGATDWAQLERYYDALTKIAPSPVVEINRAIAVAMHRGPEAGLLLLAPLRQNAQVQRYLPFHLAEGELQLRRGARAPARAAFTAALGLAMSAQERKLIEKRLQLAADA